MASSIELEPFTQLPEPTDGTHPLGSMLVISPSKGHFYNLGVGNWWCAEYHEDENTLVIHFNSQSQPEDFHGQPAHNFHEILKLMARASYRDMRTTIPDWLMASKFFMQVVPAWDEADGDLL